MLQINYNDMVLCTLKDKKRKNHNLLTFNWNKNTVKRKSINLNNLKYEIYRSFL